MTTLKRRGFFGLIGSAVMAVAIAGYRSGSGFGLVTPERWESLGYRGTHCVLLNGIDITRHCRRFNDREGWAEVLKVNASGNHFVEYVRQDGSIFVPGPKDEYHTAESLKWEARAAREFIFGEIAIRRNRVSA